MLAVPVHQGSYNVGRDHRQDIGELTAGIASLRETVAAQTANIDNLVHVANEDATAIRTLARFC